jgi:hypothetical protein
MEEARVRPPHELNPEVDPVLSALILRMLSLAPEARGTARELAEALEAAARRASPSTDPLEPERKHVPRWSLWSAVAIAAVLLLVWAIRALDVQPERASQREHLASAEDRPDAGTTDLGDAVPAAPLASTHAPDRQKAIGQDTPPEPFPGQLRTDAKGRCPGQEQIPINGGCWTEARAKDVEACAQNGYVFFKGRCYSPALAPRRKPQPTSDPTDPP